MATQIQVLDQLKQFSAGFTRKQWLVLAGGAVVTLAVLLVFVKLIAKPDFKPLFTDLDAQDSQKIGAQLAAKNIPFEITPDGKSLSVPSDQVDSARLQVAAEGMPHSGRLGFELFDKVSWGQTEFDERVNYQRALEGELERTIQSLKNVESARVHLVMPTDSVFITQERPAKASVILTLRRGQISDENQLAICRLVAGAVDKLTPENVTVIDGVTNRPIGGPKKNGWVSDGDAEHVMLTRLLSTLEPVIGADRIRASVNVEFDPSSTEENLEKYDPNSAVAVSTQRSEEQAGTVEPVGGVPGTSSNIPGAKAASAPPTTPGSQSSKTENQTFAINRISRHTVEPAGRIRRITAAIVVDDVLESSAPGQTPKRRKRTDEEMKRFETLAQAALGIDTTRGDSLAIQNVTFDIPVPGVVTKPVMSERVRTVVHDWSSILRYGALLAFFGIAYLLVLRPVKREAISAFHGASRKVGAEATHRVGGSAAIAGLGDVTSDEDKLLKTARKDLIERVTRDPAATSRLIQVWLNEDSQ